ncbi:MAG: histidinol-phosphate transaminase [Lentisphaerae bacterium]|nr:histidinol-phosphate transaminase [Lentisphaerota bacterium]MBT4817986.1 histidinol-phosphate transaminase [Lentisphaerota bacterium]MBT5605585.1 histidinol-phosphate transaminase [Lentisphaerota bacterium]MBT7054857.1 histidinol-phosphate transaminase [Lentisphaerota bacterium]MBT7841596.1 histidinol-phosphate transaminase [Lentisphaerota bacterium]
MKIRESIASMSGYVPGEQPRDRRYIKLNTNENPYPPSPRIEAALRSLDTNRLRLYPDPVCTELREAAGHLFGFGPEWVLAGNGSDDLLTIAVRTAVDQGGFLACPDPSYSLYPILAAIQGATCVTIPLGDQFELPDDVLARAEGASLLFIARPNAPTGNVFPVADIERVCAAFPGIVWVDEAYVDFSADHCVGLVSRFDNVVVSRTLSKSYSLAGIRLGWAYANPGLIAEMMKVKDSYSVNMLTQALGVEALRDTEYMRAQAARIRATRTWVSAQLTELGFDVLPSEANFVFAAPPRPAADVFVALRERGVLVRYFAQPRVDRYLRVTIGTDEDMSAFMAAIKDILNHAGGSSDN